MNITMRKVSELIPYERNTKKHDKTQIDNVAESIKQYGWAQPLVISKDNTLIIGHCRLLAAKKLKLKEVPCVCMDDLTPEQVNALRIVDNKTNESEWDFDFLAEELPEIDLSMFDFDFGMPEDEEETELIEDEAPEVDDTKEPTAKIGDIWQLGRHRLMCGDSFDKEQVEKLMGGEHVGLLLTDPPYGIDYGGLLKGKGDGHGGADKNGWKSYDAPDWDKERPNAEAFDFMRSLTDNQIIWDGNYFADVLPPKMCWLVWDKGQRDFSLADGELAWTSFDKALRIKTYSRALANREEKVHPTQKPIELLKWCIDIAEKNKAETGKVLDLFGGSGSTLMTCEQLGKKCFTMELSPKYVDVIIKRWEDFTGEKAVLLNAGH